MKTNLSQKTNALTHTQKKSILQKNEYHLLPKCDLEYNVSNVIFFQNQLQFRVLVCRHNHCKRQKGDGSNTVCPSGYTVLNEFRLLRLFASLRFRAWQHHSGECHKSKANHIQSSVLPPPHLLPHTILVCVQSRAPTTNAHEGRMFGISNRPRKIPRPCYIGLQHLRTTSYTHESSRVLRQSQRQNIIKTTCYINLQHFRKNIVPRGRWAGEGGVVLTLRIPEHLGQSRGRWKVSLAVVLNVEDRVTVCWSESARRSVSLMVLTQALCGRRHHGRLRRWRRKPLEALNLLLARTTWKARLRCWSDAVWDRTHCGCDRMCDQAITAQPQTWEPIRWDITGRFSPDHYHLDQYI